MSSKNSLTPVEKFYVAHNSDTMSLAELAKNVGKSEAVIKAYVETVSSVTVPPTTEIKKTKKKAGPVVDLMGRRFASDGSVVAVTLTPGASERLDDARESMRSKRNSQEHIHRPLDESQTRRRRKPTNG